MSGVGHVNTWEASGAKISIVPELKLTSCPWSKSGMWLYSICSCPDVSTIEDLALRSQPRVAPGSFKNAMIINFSDCLPSYPETQRD